MAKTSPTRKHERGVDAGDQVQARGHGLKPRHPVCSGLFQLGKLRAGGDKVATQGTGRDGKATFPGDSSSRPKGIFFLPKAEERVSAP